MANELQNELNQTADGFAKSLEELGGILQDKFEQVVRKTVFDLYGNIIRRSPVDTGTYRASHSIANSEPKGDEGIIYLNKSEIHLSTDLALTSLKAWTWKVGDGTIWIFNNLPYAEPLENGHSGQAPQGIYRQALTEVKAILDAQISKLKVSGYFK